MIRRKILSVITLTLLSLSNAKIMRNNALLSKMMTNFRNDNEITVETEKLPNILNTMQNVLCKNFPTIPCEIITQDKTLKNLIEESIQQINNKKELLQRSTENPGYLTLFPAANNEDYSNYIQNKEHEEIQKNPLLHKRKETNNKSKRNKAMKKSQRTSVYNRKKIRKFYPHKVKYRDKTAGNHKEELKDRSDQRISMSIEVPDITLKKRQHFSYKMEPDQPPVWRIDYMKHGDPSMNMFDFGNTKTMYKGRKTGPKLALDENGHESVKGRREVLHPDLYINKNFVRKKHVGADSDGLE